MNIGSVTTGLPTPLLDALKRNAAAQKSAPATPALPSSSGGSTFVGALDNALKSVSAAQNEATTLADAFQKDPGKVSLETAMVSMQKAQIGFQSALHVRNRLVSAYSDIMNMQV